jgi:hypothetical protein
MSDFVNALLPSAAIVVLIGFWVAFIYITAVPDRAGPGTRMWHLRDLWRWFTWKTLRR